jgi:hypothetical protein
MCLDLEVPLPCQDISTEWLCNEALGVIVDEGLLLLSRGRTPVRVSQATAVVGWSR